VVLGAGVVMDGEWARVDDASLEPMMPASRQDDADADMSMALQLSSSNTLSRDSVTASLLLLLLYTYKNVHNYQSPCSTSHRPIQ